MSLVFTASNVRLLGVRDFEQIRLLWVRRNVRSIGERWMQLVEWESITNTYSWRGNNFYVDIKLLSFRHDKWVKFTEILRSTLFRVRNGRVWLISSSCIEQLERDLLRVVNTCNLSFRESCPIIRVIVCFNGSCTATVQNGRSTGEGE
jgi:hypothetical protein